MPPTATITLTLDEVRILNKSVGRSIDAESKKVQRLTAGRMRSEVKAELDVLLDVDNALKAALDELIGQ